MGSHGLGISSWNKGLTREDPRVAKGIESMAQARRGNPPWNKGLSKETDERVLKYSQKCTGFKGKHHTEEFIEATRERMIGNRYAEGLQFSKEVLAVIGAKSKANWQNSEFREAVLNSRKLHPSSGSRGKHWKLSEETRKTQSVAAFQRWANSNYAENWFRATMHKPNLLEIRLDEFLQANFPNQWKYVGDGQMTVGRMCPDFININGKKRVMELFGSYWHQDLFEQAERINKFKSYGFDCLVVWESELNDKAKLLTKIRKFSGG